jgi:hypothetical protein
MGGEMIYGWGIEKWMGMGEGMDKKIQYVHFFIFFTIFFTTYNFYLLVPINLLENHRQDSSDIRVDLGRSLVHEIRIGRYRFGNYHSLRK